MLKTNIFKRSLIFSSVSIVDFEQVNVSWIFNCFLSLC